MSSLFFSFIVSLLIICYIASSYKLFYSHRSIIANNKSIKYDNNKRNNFLTNTCLFARYNGNTDRKSNKPMRTSSNNDVKLQQREGSRSLNQPELKARDKYAEPKIIVERLIDIKSKDRVPLSKLVTAEKHRGRIISVKKFGLFVDIGIIITSKIMTVITIFIKIIIRIRERWSCSCP